MICSLNEIETTVAKAAVGAGFEVGAARDVAAAAIWLCARGLDGECAALTALDAPPEPRPFVSDGSRHVDLGDVAVAHTGSTVFELLAGGAVEEVEIGRADSPQLLVGCGGVVAASTGVDFELVGTDARWILTGDGAVGVPAEVALQDLAHVRLMRRSDAGAPDDAGAADVSRAGGRFVAPRGVEVDDESWAALTALAAKSYVPASEASRRLGAGADVDDND